MRYERYVAIGDSQTEGLNDPDGHGGFRGWADRFAELVTVANPHLRYANLAVRGRLVGAIHREQLPAALDLRPDLVTVMGGLNDMLRPSFDLDGTAGQLDAMIAALRAAGATVLTNTFPDPAPIAPLFRRLGPRFAAYNERIGAIAERHGALVVDFARRGVGTDLRIWSPDRIHANPLGHSLIAAAFADTLGVPGYTSWADTLPPVPPIGALRRAGVELRWLGGDVAPWLLRRARGRSSGDGIVAKRPQLLPVASLFHLVGPDGWPDGGEYRPASLDTEGFVHFSFADQVAGTANRHYRDVAELVAVEVDPTLVPAAVVVEDSYGSGAAFPHVYGAVPADAAVARHPLHRGTDGRWRFSRVGEVAAASPGR